MKRMFPSILAVILSMTGAAYKVKAADQPLVYQQPQSMNAPRFLSEVRLGGSAQDPSGPESGTGNVTGEVLSKKLFLTDDAFTNLFIPRAHLGGSVNFGGKTSFAYTGFTWNYDLTRQLFLEATFGAAVHNGETGPIPKPNHNAMGCRFEFRESAAIGWRFDDHWNITAGVEHLSNAGFCAQNRGLTNIGAKLGYAF